MRDERVKNAMSINMEDNKSETFPLTHSFRLNKDETEEFLQFLICLFFQSYLVQQQGEKNLQYFTISVVVSLHKLPTIKFLELFNLIKTPTIVSISLAATAVVYACKIFNKNFN